MFFTDIEQRLVPLSRTPATSRFWVYNSEKIFCKRPFKLKVGLLPEEVVQMQYALPCMLCLNCNKAKRACRSCSAGLESICIVSSCVVAIVLMWHIRSCFSRNCARVAKKPTLPKKPLTNNERAEHQNHLTQFILSSSYIEKLS